MARAYYNEVDPYCCQWLRNLIDAGELPDGDVDERPIEEVSADDVRGYTQCHWFAGIGGWAYAGRLAGWPDDAELWSGSPPCQPFSVAGSQNGDTDERHLWPHWFRIIRERRPQLIVGEQVARAPAWLDQVSNDLASAGFTCGSVEVAACAVDAPHIRERSWFLAHPFGKHVWLQPRGRSRPNGAEATIPQHDGSRSWWQAQSRPPIVDDGLPGAVAATRAAGNSIVPPLAAQFLMAFMEAE